MKEYNVLISEEVAYRYRIKAECDVEARVLAMGIHEEDRCNISSVDRCEVIDCREVKE